jgi:hypothetical protein
MVPSAGEVDCRLIKGMNGRVSMRVRTETQDGWGPEDPEARLLRTHRAEKIRTDRRQRTNDETGESLTDTRAVGLCLTPASSTRLPHSRVWG